ncbi:YdhK family protein [Niallia sp. Sow4_A1]|uniref:YdhK family protein n=1 Tax=Niallia hominis TaxID=3133173 RepID=A0ABV1F571_9BACI|nr:MULTISPECIES: YdhK family protein [Bacillaceae]MCM3363958.1 DUF1541 domain-containing protein [Niallia sp. MER TA 168]
MKKTNKKSILYILLASLILVLGACANTDDKAQPVEEETGNQETTTNDNENPEKDTDEEMEEMDHSYMNHSGSGEVPEGLKEAKKPTYPVGSKAIIQSDHMKGMKSAEATIVGAYDTTVYTVSYTPTTGGERVEDHKWVIHEELVNPGKAPLEPGAEAKTEADHMEGMAGATLEIDSAEQTTVYMVDFTTTTGEEVKNHKWVTESELSPVK